MKYLLLIEQFKQTRHEPITEKVVKSTSIEIESQSDGEGPVEKVIKFNDGEDIKTLSFSHEQTKDGEEGEKRFIVSGQAIQHDKKKLTQFERTFSNAKEADEYFNDIVKKYPDSQIKMEYQVSDVLKTYH